MSDSLKFVFCPKHCGGQSLTLVLQALSTNRGCLMPEAISCSTDVVRMCVLLCQDLVVTQRHQEEVTQGYQEELTLDLRARTVKDACSFVWRKQIGSLI